MPVITFEKVLKIIEIICNVLLLVIKTIFKQVPGLDVDQPESE